MISRCFLFLAIFGICISWAIDSGVDTLRFTDTKGQSLWFGLDNTERNEDSAATRISCFMCNYASPADVFSYAGGCPTCPCCCVPEIGSTRPFYAVLKSPVSLAFADPLDLSDTEDFMRIDTVRGGDYCLLPARMAERGTCIIVEHGSQISGNHDHAWIFICVESIFLDAHADTFMSGGGLGYPVQVCQNAMKIRWWRSEGSLPVFSTIELDSSLFGSTPDTTQDTAISIRDARATLFPTALRSHQRDIRAYDILGRFLYPQSNTANAQAGGKRGSLWRIHALSAPSGAKTELEQKQTDH